MDPRSQTPVALVPLWLVRGGMALVIAVLAIGGLVTQTFSIVTGHDSLFGLIPKLNPAGTRNLPVWFASMTLAGAAVAAIIAGADARTRHPVLARGWWTAAGVLLALSMARMTSVGRLLMPDVSSPLQPTAAMVTFLTAVGLMAAVAALWIARLWHPLRLRLLLALAAAMTGVVMCHLGAAPDAQAAPAMRVGHAAWMTGGRALELAGLLLFVTAVTGHIRSGGRPVMVRIADDRGAGLRHGRAHGTVELRLSPRRVRLGLLLTVLAVSAASALAVWARLQLGDRVEGLYRLLNVDFEGNLPTWISAVLLLLSGAAAGVLAAAGRHARDRHWKTWALLAAVFVAMSADEAASFHELMVEPLRALVGGTPWLRYPLILPGLLAVGAGAVAFGRLIATLDTSVRRDLYRGVALFFVGALGLETVGGWFDPTVHGENAAYVALSTLEEACEMLGAAMVFVALMRHAEATMGTLRLSAGPRAVALEPAPNGPRP